jgi:peptidoglycan hydrolase CwlO-like protein
MNAKVMLVLAAALALTAASCVQVPQVTGKVQPPPLAASPAPRVDPPPAPRMVTVPGDNGATDLAFNGSAPAITETLQKTVDMLLQAKSDNAHLKAALDDAQKELTQKDAQIKELTGQLDVASGDVAKLQDALDKWKSDVLGFRDEMRKANEAEIEVLQQVLTLLKGFAKEKPVQ